MYILYNADGSVKSKKLDQYIQQGNSYSNVLFVSIADHRNFTLAGICTLPNGVKTTCTISPLETTQVIDGVTYYGKTLSITESETISAGTIRINVSATENSQVLVTFSVYLTVNETAYDSNNPVLVTWQQYNTLVTEVGNISSVEFQTTSDPNYTIAQSVKVTKNGQSTYYRFAGGGGGTSDFDYLTNRPKYNGVAMTHETNIPEVKTATWDNKLDKTGTTQEVEESANFGIAFVDDSEEPTKYSALRVVYSDDNKLVEAKVNDNGKEAIADITSETISFSVSEGDDTNGISITKDDATLTTMGESDNSIATKEYVDDVREIAEGKVQAITVSNTDTLASIKAYLENVSTAKAYLENGVEITASIKSGETYLVLNNLFTNDGISTDYIMLQSTGYVASQKNNDYYFYKADNNGLLAKKGNEILITQTNVPDWWSDGYQTVAGTTGIKVRLLETRKVDLSNYRTSAQQDVIDNGKQPLINSSNKLNPAYVNTDSSNRFVSDNEKSTWNGKSVVSVSDTGTATETVQYITINGVEKKLAGGGGSAEGAVKYNEAQTLTDNEKAQARSNIGASEVIYIDFGD